MKVKVSLFNSETNDVAIVIDLLRASTTMILALDTFNRIIPVNNKDEALQYKTNFDAFLAGENTEQKIPEFDISNSPEKIQYYKGDLLVLKTNNGTKVLENIHKRNPDVKVFIGSSINAYMVAKASLDNATSEIELVMAGRRGKFNIEDAVGAGLIIEEIENIAEIESIDIELEESAVACLYLAIDHVRAVKFIEDSEASHILSDKNAYSDVLVCEKISKSCNVPVYKDGEIRLLED